MALAVKPMPFICFLWEPWFYPIGDDHGRQPFHSLTAIGFGNHRVEETEFAHGVEGFFVWKAVTLVSLVGKGGNFLR